MPLTFATYAIGMLALAGVVPLAGFWSKDEILHAAHGWQPSSAPFYMGLAGAFLTAFYMTRQVVYVFWGKHRGAHHHGKPSSTPHESPPVMTLPLAILAACAVFLGLLGTPAWPWFEGYLTGHAAHFELAHLFSGEVLGLLALSTAVVAAGLATGWSVYGRAKPTEDPLVALLGRFHPVLAHRFYLDELYAVSVIRANAWCGWLADWLDRYVWLGLVRLTAWATIGLAWLSRGFDEWIINGGFDTTCEGARRGGQWLAGLQSARAQNWLRVLGVALTLLVLFLVWLHQGGAS
jgi:NADH-quinone oxidoreductase subunit L